MSDLKASGGTADLHWQSLADVARQIRQGELTSVAVTQHMLDRIEQHNPRLHCYCQVLAESALARAAALDAARERGDALGSLHGVPVALKDLLDTQGVVTASGTRVMSDHVPESNATVVDKLHDAGAVVLGKVQLTEGAYGSHHPEIKAPINPWGEGLWSGVSSSGSGVSVASGLAFSALGSDTGGSIRFPSAANGLVGIKATYGRVSRHGAFPLAESLDHIGPLARSVEDAALMLQAIAGHDDNDPNSVHESPPDFLGSHTQGVQGMRFGVDWDYAGRGVAPEVVATLRTAADTLQGLGAEIVEVPLPSDYHSLVRNWVVTCGVECALAHEGMFPEKKDLYGPDLTGLIELGRKVGALQYSALERVRERFRQQLDELFTSIDGFLCPAMPVPVPTIASMAEALEDAEAAQPVFRSSAPGCRKRP